MKNWFNAADAVDLLRRLEGLKPDARPQWGVSRRRRSSATSPMVALGRDTVT